MDDLSIPSGPGIPSGLVVPADELLEQFSRSSGPGGQSVNTTDSRVQLEFDVAGSRAFTDAQRQRVLRALAAQLTEGRLQLQGSEHRSQHRNRMAVRERLSAVLREALAPPPPTRRATKATKGSHRRRLSAKKERGQTKKLRGRVRDE